MLTGEITEEYLNSKNARENDLQPLRDFAIRFNIPIVLPQTESLLRTMVSIKQPERILEIGTAIGYSGLIMLMAAPNAALTTLEKDEEINEIAYENFQKYAQNKVTQYLGDAIDILQNLCENTTNKFDLIFLDGPKAQYIKYLPLLLKLLDSGGVLICDNVLFKGMVAGEIEAPRQKNSIVKNLRAFNDEVLSNKSLVSTIINVGDGVMLSCKK